MNVVLLILLYVATVIGMEAFAYAMHRWVMHGLGWFLHASHHRPRTGYWEWNDLYFVIFALPSILMLAGGVRWGLVARKNKRDAAATQARVRVGPWVDGRRAGVVLSGRF